MKLGLNTMRWSLNFGFWGPGFGPTVEMVQAAEALGYDSVWASEAYGTDAVTPLGMLAGQTSRINLGTNVMQMAGRSPATAAMTAVTLDHLSDGRFVLGLGVSGPAVVEGWHCQPYGSPLTRAREYVEVVRRIVAHRDPVEHHGAIYDLPYQGDGATGLGRPMRLAVRPRRRRIPIYAAAMGPRNVRLALETCEGILPVAWSPAREAAFFGDGLDLAALGPVREELGLGPLQIAPLVPVVVGADVDACFDQLRTVVAFWLGAMGPPSKNFYNQLAVRFGYGEAAAEVQRLYAAGRRRQAAAAIPTDMLDEMSLCGPKERIAERVEPWKSSSVTTMILCGVDRAGLELLAELVL